MKSLIMLWIQTIWLPLVAVAQLSIPELPPDSLFFASLDSFYIQKQAAEHQPYTLAKKGEWLSYMPSVGMSYALRPTSSGSFKSSPVPTISINANAIGSAIHRKKLRRAHFKHVTATLALQRREDRILLQKRLDQFKHEIQALSLYQQVHRIQNQIDTIKKAQLDSLLIKPSEYLATQEVHLKQTILYNQKVAAIRDLYWEIISLSRHSAPIQ